MADVIHGGFEARDEGTFDVTPFVIANVPHLGKLKIVCHTAETITVETVDRSQNPLFADCDHAVEINKVPYSIKVTVHSGARLAEKRGESGHPVILTTDETWGARPFDLTARRVGGRYNQTVTPSATQKIVKRAVLFLDGYMGTETARQLIAAGDRYNRAKRADKSRREIIRLRNLLNVEERKLAEALRADVHDLLDLRVAFENDDDVFDAIHQIVRD